MLLVGQIITSGLYGVGLINLFGLVVIHFIFGLGGHMVWISLISDEELAYYILKLGQIKNECC